MAFFRLRSKNINFGKFSESHFKSEVLKILWRGETVLAEGFFAHAEDPYGVQDLPVFLPGTNPHTYLVITQWRFIESSLNNGEFVSHEFKYSKPEIFKQRSRFYLTYTHPAPEGSEYLNPRITYLVSKDIADAILQNLKGSQPYPPEVTKIFLAKEFFGEGPLADVGRITLGQDYMWIEVCETCGGSMLAAEDAETSLAISNNKCRVCLRVTL